VPDHELLACERGIVTAARYIGSSANTRLIRAHILPKVAVDS